MKSNTKQFPSGNAPERSGFTHIIGILSLLLYLMHNSLQAQDKLDVIRDKWLHFSDAPNALYHHLSGQAYELLEKRSDAIARLHTLSDWQERQAWLRETLLDVVGPFPEKTPLNPKILRNIDKQSYRIEHIVFESQPGFYVTSSLFIPAGLKGKAPAVIYCSGHAGEGYRSNTYQHVILNLVKKGFIVFAFDPVGQGERLEYFDPNTGKSAVGGPTKEHSYPGAQAFITGSSQAQYMIWDGIRAVDYLLSRKEVDADRIGITGRSGGGTQSAYIAALDERIHAVAPENYITNFTRLLQSIGPQDAEQNLPAAIMRGLDHADLLAVRAPKPALMIATTGDFFNIQGARETAKEVSKIYHAYGKPEHFTMVEDDAGHASTQKNREALYAFFQNHLDNPGTSEDEEVMLPSPEELQVTSTGQVSTSLGGETVFSLNRQEAAQRISTLQASRKNLNPHLSSVLTSAQHLSGYQAPTGVDEPVFTGRIQREGYVIEKYFLQGKDDHVVPYLLMIPDKPNQKAMLYLHPAGKSAEAAADGQLAWFVSRGFTVLAPDLPGVGEVGNENAGGDSNIEGTSYNLWFNAMLIGKSIVGVQATDVVRLTRLLKEKAGADQVYGVAIQAMAPVLLHAAAFDQTLAHIALIEPYASYRSVVMDRFYNPAFIPGTVPGALKAYDLPDLAASLAPRKLMIVDVTNGTGNTPDPENIHEDISFIRAAYQSRNAGGQLHIISGTPSDNPHDLFMDWIK